MKGGVYRMLTIVDLGVHHEKRDKYAFLLGKKGRFIPFLLVKMTTNNSG